MALTGEELTPEDRVAREFNRLRGRLAGHVESYSLSPKVERGIVSMMKTLSYDAEANIKKLVKQ